MKQILNVCAFTFKSAIRKKAFIISTVIIFLLIAVLSMLPRLLADDSDDNASDAKKNNTCYYIEDSDKTIISGAIEALAAEPDFSAVNFIKADVSDIEKYSEEMKNDGDIAIIVVTLKENHPSVKLIVKDFMNGPSPDTISSVLTKAYATNLLTSLLTEANADTAVLDVLNNELQIETQSVSDMDFSGYLLGIAILMLTFFAIYYYGYSVSMSVATEKTSRVMETLVVSAKPSRILIGKCLGMGLLGLLQFASVVGFAALCYNAFVPADFTISGMTLSLSAFTPESAILIILYFILGYSLFAVLNSVCGALVSKIEDVSSAMMPVMLLTVIGFYLGYITAVMGAEGTIKTVAIYLPISAPFVVPFELINGKIASTDLFISISLLIISIVAVTLISIRLYSASVLHYGKKLKLTEALKRKI